MAWKNLLTYSWEGPKIQGNHFCIPLVYHVTLGQPFLLFSSRGPWYLHNVFENLNCYELLFFIFAYFGNFLERPFMMISWYGPLCLRTWLVLAKDLPLWPHLCLISDFILFKLFYEAFFCKCVIFWFLSRSYQGESLTTIMRKFEYHPFHYHNM